MKLVYDKEYGWVHIRGNKFLRLGEKKKVKQASERQRAEMYQISLAFDLYNEIQFSQGHTIN